MDCDYSGPVLGVSSLVLVTIVAGYNCFVTCLASVMPNWNLVLALG